MRSKSLNKPCVANNDLQSSDKLSVPPNTEQFCEHLTLEGFDKPKKTMYEA